MDGDEMEMSKEELQRWIKQKVKKNKLLSSDLLEKCNLLQALLERREKQAAHLLRLCKSVSACEEIVKKLYSLLGWEYRDTDSDDDDDDDDDMTGCGNTVPSSATPTGPTHLLPKLQDSANLRESSTSLKRELVVVLTRLSIPTIRSLRRQKHKRRNSDYEFFKDSDVDSDLDSDSLWEPEDRFSLQSCKTGPNKRRKTHQMNKKLAERHESPQARTNTGAESNAATTETPHASASNCESNGTKTSTPPENTNGAEVNPVCIVAICQAPEKPITTCSMPSVELKMNMTVVARRAAMGWYQGKITEIVTKEDSRLKYKVHFEVKGKSFVSSHHIAFGQMPKLEQLFVGARVVVKGQADQSQFCPGVLGELPTRRNRMRFLVFTDEHKPIYVGLPLLRLVCKPLADPLDDIPDGAHKSFMRGYMEAWPYPPQTDYKVGQTINVTLDGVLQKCEVKMVDCSLMQVIVLADQHKMWIYRGSTYLEHMVNVMEPMKKKKKDEGQRE